MSNYQNSDIQQLATDLMAAFGGSTAGTPSLNQYNNPQVYATPLKSISITNNGDANGTVLGTTLGPGLTVNFVSVVSGFVFDATGTTFLVSTIV